MKKALTKIIAAALTAAAMLSPMPSNAILQIVRENDDILGIVERRMKSFSRVENVHFLDWATFDGTAGAGFEYIYVNEDGTQFIAFEKINGLDIYIELADDVDSKDVEEALFERFGEKYENVQFRLEDAGMSDTDYYLKTYWLMRYPSVNEAVEWLDFMKEQGFITSGKLYTERYSMSEFFSHDTGLKCFYTPKSSTRYALIDFVENELDGYSVEVLYPQEGEFDEESFAYHHIEIIPPENATLMERIEAAEMIYEATGATPNYETPTNMSSVDSGCIDIFNAVKGDANLDGRTTVADAVAILQSIGNNDKYPLSAQGRFNGDIVGNYDGITAADALEIQILDSQNRL